MTDRLQTLGTVLSELPYDARFYLAGGAVGELTDKLVELQAENPERFAYLRGLVAEQVERATARESAELRKQLAKAGADVRAFREQRLRSSSARVDDDMFTALINGTLDPKFAPLVAARDWWAKKTHPWIVLSGGTGIGKTVAAADVLLDHHGSYEWISVDEFVRYFQATWGPERAMQDRIKATQLLIIEDLGKEQAEPKAVIGALLEMLDCRLSVSRTPTIITTNMVADGGDKIDGFKQRYNEQRLLSRMRQYVRWVALVGKDQRRAVSP